MIEEKEDGKETTDQVKNDTNDRWFNNP